MQPLRAKNTIQLLHKVSSGMWAGLNLKVEPLDCQNACVAQAFVLKGFSAAVLCI